MQMPAHLAIATKVLLSRWRVARSPNAAIDSMLLASDVGIVVIRVRVCSTSARSKEWRCRTIRYLSLAVVANRSRSLRRAARSLIPELKVTSSHRNPSARTGDGYSISIDIADVDIGKIVRARQAGLDL